MWERLKVGSGGICWMPFNVCAKTLMLKIVTSKFFFFFHEFFVYDYRNGKRLRT